MDFLKNIVYVPIGSKPGIPVGTGKEYINLSETETAKLLHVRLNRNRTSADWLSLWECTEYAQKIRNQILREYRTELAKPRY